MRLIKCHIEGFGKIHNQDYEFKKGLNEFCKENGYGKSTLASFIKVMLYGFEDESKRSLKDKEREKYRPWNKGTYGGSMTFEFEGKEYEVSRTFGKNEGEDSFEVRDLLSNNVCDDFEKGSLGIKIFGIDKDSFFRTAYIASSDQNKKDESVTDSIRAKLGNLTNATDDINNFENACDRFEKKLNEYSPDRKTGKIKSLKSKISEMSNRFRNFDNVDKATEIIENQINAEIAKIDFDKSKIKELKAEESKVRKAEAIKAKRAMYESIIDEYNDQKKKADEIREAFPLRIPELGEINESKEKLSKMNHLEEEMNENKIDSNENTERIFNRFKDGLCSEEEVKRYISLWNEVQKKQSDALEKERTLESEISEYVKTEEEKRKEKFEIEEERFKKAEKKRKILLAIMIVLALVFFGAAAALTVLGIMGIRGEMYLWQEVVLFAISVIFLVLIFLFRLNQPSERERISTLVTNDEALIHVDTNGVRRRDIESIKNEVTLLTGQTRNFLEKYKGEFEEDKVVDELVKLLDDAKEYGRLKNKKEEYEKDKNEYEKNLREVNSFFESCGIVKRDDAINQLNDLSELLVMYRQHKEEAERKKIILVQFESENDIKEISEIVPEDLRNIDDIMDEISELEEELEEKINNMSGYRKRLEDCQEERDELANLGVEIEEDKETLVSYENNYLLLGKTLEYLTKAKDALSLKYTGPTMEGFKKYCSYFAGDTEDFKIDTDFNLTKSEEGMQRRISDMSLGLKEVTDFCMRLALTDAMYEKEKPFIILDDPFTNFDAGNLMAAMRVLRKLEEDCQILYFTCHESRSEKALYI